METSELNWEAEYTVGVDEIDTQHKNLMNHINELVNRIHDEGKKYLKKQIAAAVKEIKNHFETEEELLARTEYAKFTDHRKEHEALTTKILRIQDELKNSNKDIDIINLTINLKEWFMSHILLYDIEAKEYFKSAAAEEG